MISQIPNQGYDNDATFFLADMQNNWSIGNPCGEDNYMTIECYDNMNMNGNILNIYYANITIQGQIINEGPITFMCDSAVLTVLEETLEVEQNETIDYTIKMYPNPARDFIHIDGQGITDIIFYNLNGIVVKHYITPTIENIINVSNLPSGMYIIQVLNINNKIITKKLIKQ